MGIYILCYNLNSTLFILLIKLFQLSATSFDIPSSLQGLGLVLFILALPYFLAL